MRKRTPKRDSDIEAAPVDHYTRLAAEVGHARGGHYTASDDGRPVGGSRFWLQPVTLFILSLIALVVVGGLQIWRLGLLDPLFAAESAVVDTAPKRWMLNDRAAPAPDDTQGAQSDPGAGLNMPADDDAAPEAE